MSNTKLIDKGVPQGSILGPLLFTIFINDFPSCLSNAFCNIFADDTMIGISDKSITKIQQLLQNCLFYPEIDLLTLMMTFNHKNNTRNGLPSQNHIKMRYYTCSWLNLLKNHI